LKMLYLATMDITKKWAGHRQDWGQIHLEDGAVPMDNNLKSYNYFKYLLEEIPRHMDEHGVDFCEDLLPWSDTLPVECRKQLELYAALLSGCLCGCTHYGAFIKVQPHNMYCSQIS